MGSTGKGSLARHASGSWQPSGTLGWGRPSSPKESLGFPHLKSPHPSRVPQKSLTPGAPYRPRDPPDSPIPGALYLPRDPLDSPIPGALYLPGILSGSRNSQPQGPQWGKEHKKSKEPRGYEPHTSP